MKSFLFEYQTPKVVTVTNIPLGILKTSVHLGIIIFVIIYNIWYARGYQQFIDIETSVTTKVKGFSK